MRYTDKVLAAALKSNAEGLQRAGVEPSVLDMEYVLFAEAEDRLERAEQTVQSVTLENSQLRQTIRALYNENDRLRAALQRTSENAREWE